MSLQLSLQSLCVSCCVLKQPYTLPAHFVSFRPLATAFTNSPYGLSLPFDPELSEEEIEGRQWREGK